MAKSKEGLGHVSLDRATEWQMRGRTSSPESPTTRGSSTLLPGPAARSTLLIAAAVKGQGQLSCSQGFGDNSPMMLRQGIRTALHSSQKSTRPQSRDVCLAFGGDRPHGYRATNPDIGLSSSMGQDLTMALRHFLADYSRLFPNTLESTVSGLLIVHTAFCLSSCSISPPLTCSS